MDNTDEPFALNPKRLHEDRLEEIQVKFGSFLTPEQCEQLLNAICELEAHMPPKALFDPSVSMTAAEKGELEDIVAKADELAAAIENSDWSIQSRLYYSDDIFPDCPIVPNAEQIRQLADAAHKLITDTRGPKTGFPKKDEGVAIFIDELKKIFEAASHRRPRGCRNMPGFVEEVATVLSKVDQHRLQSPKAALKAHSRWIEDKTPAQLPRKVL
jgi:hypothetical protein